MAIHSRQPIRTLALFTPSECIAWLTVLGIEALAMVTINALEIIIYLKEHSLRKRDMYLVINQAVADMFVGGYVIFECWRFGGNCDFWALNCFSVIAFSVLVISFYFFALASLLNLTAISLDRTLATFRPFKHRLVKKKNFGVVVLVIWITAGLFITSVVLTFSNRRRTLKVSAGIFLTHFSSFLFCLLIIILVSYSSTAIKIVCHMFYNINQPHHHGATNRERKLTKTLFIVTIVSLLLTLPYVILQIHFLVSVLSRAAAFLNTFVRLYLSVLSLLFGNSFLNPGLCIFRMTEFKKALFNFLGCRSQLLPAQVLTLNEM
ncbi:D(1)-like dopamine receptor [Acropora millepora]|uniref:D(1)-like dopamine receptor n=1 Tax=Acropora millepora TaxID=45264 RepID=UPI001CF4AD74|nr:D(1)-like dopamine receptor [Acropora millepora]